MLTLEIQAVEIAFNLINICIADLSKRVLRISYDGTAGVSSTGLPIKFAVVSVLVLSYKPSVANAQVMEEKNRVVVGNDR